MLVWVSTPQFDSRAFLLLDRDGIINEDRPDYIKHPREFHFYPDALQALRWLREHHVLVILISNQSGVNRGIIAWEDFRHIHEGMINGIQNAGGEILGTFYCPHRPEEGCSCRKPSPGMIEAAATIFPIPLSATHLIGDRNSDMLAASRAGCRGVLVDRFGEGIKDLQPYPPADPLHGKHEPESVESNPAQQSARNTAPQNEVIITPGRHSRTLLAGIQKKSLDARLRGHDGRISDTPLCGSILGTQYNSLPDAASEPNKSFSNLMDTVLALFETSKSARTQ